MDRQHLRTALEPLGFSDIVAVTEMAGGSTPAYRIDLAEGLAIVLKLYPDLAGKGPRKDAFASAQLENIDVPISRFLLVDDTQSRLPFRFALTNYLPGVTVGSLRHHPNVASLYRQAGALLRKLHTVSMPAYGAFDAQGIAAPLPSNAAYMQRLIEHAMTEFVGHGGDGVLAMRLRTILEHGFDAVVPHSRGAVFAHDDLHPNNILAIEEADGTLSLSGLIDFGNARAADSISDLAKCLFCSEHEAPGCTPYILDGYGPLDHPRPTAALEYYTLIHRVVMWWWLRHIGVIPTPNSPSDIMDKLRQVAG